MSAQPEPTLSKGSGGSAASFQPDGPSGMDGLAARARATAVVLPLRPERGIGTEEEADALRDSSQDRTGAARGLLLGLGLGALLWLLIGLAVWRLLLR